MLGNNEMWWELRGNQKPKNFRFPVRDTTSIIFCFVLYPSLLTSWWLFHGLMPHHPWPHLAPLAVSAGETFQWVTSEIWGL